MVDFKIGDIVLWQENGAWYILELIHAKQSLKFGYHCVLASANASLNSGYVSSEHGICLSEVQKYCTLLCRDDKASTQTTTTNL